MLTSKRYTNSYLITNSSYVIDQTIIPYNELILIYYADQVNNLSYKSLKSYELRHEFFTNNDFTFNIEFVIDINTIKQHIDILNKVNESFIKDFINKYTDITFEMVVQFYINYIYFILDKLTNIPNISIIDDKYSLLLKNSELLTILNKNYLVIIENLKNLYNDINGKY